jgi:hypothetical protein
VESFKGIIFVLLIIVQNYTLGIAAEDDCFQPSKPPSIFVRKTLQDDLEEAHRLIEKVELDLKYLEIHYTYLSKIHSYLSNSNESINSGVGTDFVINSLEDTNPSHEGLTKLFWSVGVTCFLNALLEERWERIQDVTYRLNKAETLLDQMDCADFEKWLPDNKKAYELINQKINDAYAQKQGVAKILDQSLLNFNDE